MPEQPTPTAISQTKLQIFLRFLKFGFLAWGGPMAQIAMLKKELVEEEEWITKERFNRALAVYQVLPGPEAHELCVYSGMVAGGRMGGFLAGLGFMLPGFMLMLLFTWPYVNIGLGSPLIQAIFLGFQAAVIALIVAAVHRIGKHAIINWKLMAIAGASFIAYFCGVGFYIVLPLAGLAYVFWMQEKLLLVAFCGVLLATASVFLFNPEILQPPSAPVQSTTIHVVNSSPLAVSWTGLKAGLLTFGGAYTAIPFLQQDAVIEQGWLSNRQFLDGIALSGILPAPLIIFSTFVGYFGAGWPGALLMTFAIFLPAFSFTLLGHNLVEKVINNKALHSFLDGVTAGVIGLIAMTAVLLFKSTVTDWFSLIVFAVSVLLLYHVKSKFTVVFVILGAGLAGMVWHLIL